MSWSTFRILTTTTLPTITPNTDVAIVLGAAVWRNQPSPVFAARIDYALDLLKAGRVDVIIFTGGLGSGDQRAESTAAARYAIERGISTNQLRCETTSNTTWGNLLAAATLMKQDNWQTATLVSDPLHIHRAMLMANDLGLQPQPGPTPYTRYRTWNSQVPFLLRELFFVNQYHLQRLLPTQSHTRPEVGDGHCSIPE